MIRLSLSVHGFKIQSYYITSKTLITSFTHVYIKYKNARTLTHIDINITFLLMYKIINVSPHTNSDTNAHTQFCFSSSYTHFPHLNFCRVYICVWFYVFSCAFPINFDGRELVLSLIVHTSNTLWVN